MREIKNNYSPLQRLEVIYEGWGENWPLGTLAAGRQRGEWLFEYSEQSIQRGIEFSPCFIRPSARLTPILNVIRKGSPVLLPIHCLMVGAAC
ncbi:hypothetical protein [Candidatus Pantoea bituminis]|uniref:hypothetical protein n=1 Tax=Candidatus Pantoea bituminis TaxID=2831036 RepID=UPI00208ECDFB|nr:hypothetical protein [Pantoea bituminis]